MEVLLWRMKKCKLTLFYISPLTRTCVCMSSHTHTREMPLTYTELSAGSFPAISPAMVPIIILCYRALLQQPFQKRSNEGQSCSALHLGFPHRHQGARKVKVKKEPKQLYLFLPLSTTNSNHPALIRGPGQSQAPEPSKEDQSTS